MIDPHPALDALHAELAEEFRRRVTLQTCSRDDLTSYGGEMDSAVRMPGVTSWTCGDSWTARFRRSG